MIVGILALKAVATAVTMVFGWTFFTLMRETSLYHPDARMKLYLIALAAFVVVILGIWS